MEIRFTDAVRVDGDSALPGKAGGEMRVREVVEHVHQVSLGMVKVFLIERQDGLTMVDAGLRSSWPRIQRAILGLGKRPEDVSDILVTHLHADHTGGLADAQGATGARVWMHPEDAAMVRRGEASRPWAPTPGSLTGSVMKSMTRRGRPAIIPLRVICEVTGGETIQTAGGVVGVWTPGHTLGHMAYLWPRQGGVLFVGDAAVRVLRLQTAPIYEDLSRGIETLRNLASLEFDAACFAHGRALVGGAREAFRKAWPPR